MIASVLTLVALVVSPLHKMITIRYLRVYQLLGVNTLDTRAQPDHKDAYVGRDLTLWIIVPD